jgi:hypothetical protein
MTHKLLLVIIICFGCTLPPREKVLEVDSKGRVLKTFNGQLLKKYDTSGNLIEFYGKVDYDDWEGCVHDKIFYNEKNDYPHIVPQIHNLLKINYLKLLSAW